MARRFFSGASSENADRLHELCRRGGVKEVKEYVEQISDLENQLTSKIAGITPLHEAAKNGHYRVVDYLLNKVSGGASVVDCTSSGGYTPLHFAASKGDIETLTILLKHKADISAQDEYGRTPKQTAELNSKRNAARILRSEGNCCECSCV